MDFWSDIALTEVFHLKHDQHAKVMDAHDLNKIPHEPVLILFHILIKFIYNF